MRTLYAATGSSFRELAQVAAQRMIETLVVLKNVPLDLNKRAMVAQEALEWLTADEIEQLAMSEREGAAALTQSINRMLDIYMIGRTLEHICARAGVGVHDVNANGVMGSIVAMVEADARDKTCLRWPGIGDLADRFYANLVSAPGENTRRTAIQASQPTLAEVTDG